MGHSLDLTLVSQKSNNESLDKGGGGELMIIMIMTAAIKLFAPTCLRCNKGNMRARLNLTLLLLCELLCLIRGRASASDVPKALGRANKHPGLEGDWVKRDAGNYGTSCWLFSRARFIEYRGSVIHSGSFSRYTGNLPIKVCKPIFFMY